MWTRRIDGSSFCHPSRLFSGLLAFLLHAELFAQTSTTPPLAAASGGSSGLLQMLFGLGIVLAVILGAAWLLRRLGVPHTGSTPLLKAVGALSIGTRERVVVIEIEGQWLVLGVAPGRINTLHTLPKGDLASKPPLGLSTQAPKASQAPDAPQAFTQKLQQVLRNCRSPS